MTRINCVPVTVLTDKHLMAEYKEITRPFGKMRKRIESGKLDFVVPEKYTMGTGHESFFFNKLYFLWKRFCEIYVELKYQRNYNVNNEKYNEIADSLYREFNNNPFWQDWKPTPEDMYVNMARLAHRHFKTNLGEFS